MARKYDSNKPSPYDSIIMDAANRAGVSPDLLRKQIWYESDFNPKAQSPTGPRGLGQFTKATGAAFGLVTDDDFFDPIKSVNAAATHMAELVKKFGGDELKAMLAYNQGEGRDGAPQLAAYDSGDYSKVKPEGLAYMKEFADLAKSTRAGEVADFGGLTPKAKPLTVDTLDVLTEGFSPKPKVVPGQNVPDAAIMKVEGQDVPAPRQAFGEAYWQQKGETLEQAENRSTFFGLGKVAGNELANSTLGVAVRAGRAEGNGLDVIADVFGGTRFNDHVWSREELDQIRNSGVRPEYYSAVTGGSAENLPELIRLALENQKADDQNRTAGMGAQIVGGFVGAAGDPFSYVPVAGNVGRGGKLINKMFTVGAQTGVAAVAGEGVRSSVAGGDAHLAEAAIGGAAFGAGMTALGDLAAKALGHSNEFASPAIRLEARETARNTNMGDLSTHPIQEGEELLEHGGVQYANVPGESSSARLTDGSILIGENLANPKSAAEFAKVDPERSARGLTLGGVTEIGYKLLRSEDTAIRGVAQDLVRSPVGMEGGNSGKFGATASDISERLRHNDHQTYNQMFADVNEAIKDPLYALDNTRSKQRKREDVYRRVATAIEDSTGELMGQLTQGELKVLKTIKDNFDTKREMMENPAMFGNKGAKSIFPESRHKGTYVPNVYSTAAKTLYTQQLGGPEGLQKAIAESMMTSYRSRPEVRKRVDDMNLEQAGEGVKLDEAQLEAAAEKYAMDKAYGISHTENFDRSSIIEDNLNGMVGIENNEYLEARHLFDSDMSVTLPDGNLFSLNDLREYDMDKIMPSYNRRVNGDIAIMGGTGKTTKELKDEVAKLSVAAGDNGVKKSEVAALEDVMKILTGRARRNQDTVGDTLVRSLNDLSFVAKNAYMGAQNLTEIGGMVARGNLRAIMHSVPVFRDMATRTKKMSGSELKEIHKMVFGRELDDSIRPSRADVIDRLRQNTDASDMTARAVGSIKYVTQEAAVRSPFTKFLNETSNYLADAGRQGFLSDIVEHALTGSNRKFDDRWVKGASLTPDQYQGVLSLIRESVTQGPDGKFTIKDKKAFSKDPRAMDLWRMGDKIADETLLRPHHISSQDSKAYGALAKTVLQFKNFVIKSVNGRFIRSYYEATKNGRAVDQALSLSASLALAGTYYVAQAHLKASTMQDEAATEYLKSALDPAMIGYASLSRSSVLGGPLGIANLLGGVAGFDQAKMVRSSILPKDKHEREGRAVQFQAGKSDPVMGFVGNVLEQVPAFGYAANAAMIGYNAVGYLKSNKRADELDYMTGMYNTFRELVPNDPITQRILLSAFEENGIHTRK